MTKKRNTLRLRVISSLVLVALALISAFAVIQIKNKLESIYTYNYYRANIGPIITRLLYDKDIDLENLDKLLENLKNTTLSLRDRNIADEVILYTKDGEVLASTPADPSRLSMAPSDLFRIEEAAKSDKGIYIHTDSKNQIMYVYMMVYGTYGVKLSFLLSNMQEAINQVFIPVVMTAVLVFLTCIIFGFFLSKSIIDPIIIFNEATKDIAAGNLDLMVKITTNDELEELSDTFNTMTTSLKKMKAIAENANPLTRLPGNRLLQDEIENRIRSGRQFVVVHTDLDNFKAFNDKYGLEKGDEAIKLSADILKDTIKVKGNRTDFLGHIGGDDFVFITSPEKDREICDEVIRLFDDKIKALYDADDLRRGFILAKGRDEEEKEFPIMTISLSGVTNTHRPLKSYAEITNIAADIKKKAKKIPQSVYVIDKRTN